MTYSEAEQIFDATVSAFFARNPDLTNDFHMELVLYGALSPEMRQRIVDRMVEEGSNA